jgi:hypothetical protein
MPNAMPSPSAMPAPTSMPYATGAMPYADGGVVDDALRLARNNYDDGGYISREPMEKGLGEYVTKTPRTMPGEESTGYEDSPRLSALRTVEGQSAFPALWSANNPVLKQSMGRQGGYAETYIPTEPGSPDNPNAKRPVEFGPAGPKGRTGVEVYRSDMTGADIAQELLHSDPHSHDTRARMLKSLSPEQRHTLAEGLGDYEESLAQGQSKERAYQNAMDGALRAYIANRSGAAHHQAPQIAVDEMGYTPQQLKMLERLYGYTQTGKYAQGGEVEDALRLANQGKYRLHQTIARHGYATDGEVKPEEPQVEAYGEVEFAPEYMPRPTEQVQQPNEASSQAFIHEGLKGSAPQYDPTVERGIGHGLTATAKWTPPGAVADAAGLLGGPSLYQNVKEGRYMPAALQVASVGLPAALAGRAAIAAGLGAGASKFTKLGKPDAYGMPGYIGYQTAEDWGPGVLGKETYEGAKKAGKAALEKGTNYIKSKFGYADGGEVGDALRLARYRQGYATKGEVEGDVQFAPEYMPRPTEQVQQPNEASSQAFIHEGLKGSAPQYDPEGGMKTAKEAGQLVAGMTTPGAIADAAGYLGGPSALQNVRDKNYGTAALQLAGAIPGIGPLAKASRIAEEAKASKNIIPKAINKILSELPMDEESRLARAAEQGYTIDAYKGSPAFTGGPTTDWKGNIISNEPFEEIKSFSSPEKPYAGFFSNDPAVASKFADVFSNLGSANEWGSSVFPTKLKMTNPLILDAKGKPAASFQFESIAREHGSHDNLNAFKNAFEKDSPYDGVIIKNTSDEGTVYVPKSPNQIRSRFAKFDPKNIKDTDILKSHGGEVEHALQLASGGGAWTRKEGQDPDGGLNSKGRASAKAEGHNLKPPAPHPKTEKDAGRRKSFCSRMSGMREKLTSAETKNDPDSRINKSLRAWNCSDGGAVEDAIRLASGGEVWEKPRPKSLGKPKHLSESQKASAKASAKAAGRPYPNAIDNINAAKRGK